MISLSTSVVAVVPRAPCALNGLNALAEQEVCLGIGESQNHRIVLSDYYFFLHNQCVSLDEDPGNFWVVIFLFRLRVFCVYPLLSIVAGANKKLVVYLV